MRHHNHTVFDEFLVGATGSTNAVFTSSELNARLGHYDEMAIQAVVDDINVAGSFNLTVQHSADGRNFTPWNSTTPDLVLAIAVNASNVGYCSVPTAALQTPLLSFVRFQMYFTTTANGHVRITVTHRDTGG